MMMIAILEQEFLTSHYNEDQVKAVKSVLGNLGKFLKECGEEWEKYEQTLKK